jgi:hypothetical protein
MRLWMVALALCGLAAAADAGGEVADDSKWIAGNETVTFDITANPTSGTVTVTVTDSTGTSAGVTGTPGTSSTSTAPTTSGTPDMGTPGGTYRANPNAGPNSGKPQYKNTAGDWVNMKKKKVKKVNTLGLRATLGPGDNVTSLPH